MARNSGAFFLFKHFSLHIRYQNLFTAFFNVNNMFYHEYLSYIRKIRVFIQLDYSPDVSGFNTPYAEIWLLVYIFKIESNISHELLLVSFDCKMLVGISLCYHVTGEFSLSLQGIRSDDYSTNFDAIK